MNNILLTFESYEPSNQETYKFLIKVQELGLIRLRSKRCVGITRKDLDWCDVIYSVRSTSSIEASLSKYAKRLGKYWITLLDDDFLSLGKNYGQDGQGYREEKKKCLKRVLKNTDCLIVSNNKLIEKYSKYGKFKRTYKSETGINCENLVVPQKTEKRVKIVYYVNDGTTTMFEKYLRPAFYRIAEKYPQRVSLYLMAVHPDFHDLDQTLDIHYVPHMRFDAFLKYIADQHFDIGLAPLDDNGFSRYKYVNKFVEYSRAGVAGIYSDCELYRSVITSGENGILCKNTVDGWVEAISGLIEDDDYKVCIAKGAQEYVRNNMSMETVIKSFVQSIPEFGEYKAPDIKAKSFVLIVNHAEYWLFRIRGWIYTVFNCIRTGNMKGLFCRAMRKIGRDG